MANESLKGIAPLNNYGSLGSNAARVDALIALIPDPDTKSSSGAQAGGGMLDEMSPIAAATLRVELIALKASLA